VSEKPNGGSGGLDWLEKLKDTLKTMFAHLREAEVGYFQHLTRAWGISLKMLVGGVAAFVHGLLPFACGRAASTVIKDLARMLK